MAIEFFDGFESGGFEIGRWQGAGNFTIGTGANGPRNGSYHLNSNGNNSGLVLNLPATAKKTFGMAYSGSVGWNNGTHFVIQMCSDAGVTGHVCITIDAAGHFQLRRGGPTGTILATSTLVFTPSVWHYVEMSLTVDDATGTCIVRVDSVEWINFTGDTRNAGTSTLIDGVRFYGANNIGYEPKIDDIYATNGTDDTATTGRPDNAFLGDIKVEPLYPNGNGASSQWVGSDADSVNNYLLVDEAGVPNTADYVGTATDGNRDLYDLFPVSAGTATVLALRPNVYAAKSDAGSAAIKMLIRESSGTVTAEAAQALSVSYQPYYGLMRTTKPSGGAWTVAEVNALQVGLEKAP
jgi:hypothetical protein